MYDRGNEKALQDEANKAIRVSMKSRIRMCKTRTKRA